MAVNDSIDPAAGAPALSAECQPRVLLVDDQAMVGEAIRRALAAEPLVEFRYCSNPADALQVAEGFKPTVILQDLVMPNVDGLTLVRAYRSNALTADIPIIVLSTKEEPTVKRDAFAVGANDYLIKLPDAVELIARIRHHSKAYMNQLQRDAAYRALHESQRQLVKMNAELQRLSNVDGLTGLSNRRYFNEYADAQWKLALRERKSLAILMIDVDDFKRYNDTYGHLAGDDVLKIVATAVRGSFFRPTDLAARFGGEEFVILLPSTPFDMLQELGERVRQNVDAANILHKASTVGGHVTISVGGSAVVPRSDSSIAMLIESADQGLYAAKKAGKNCVIMREPAS
jgi:two-component system, chemotaxis family, response regulator WspR